MARGLVRLQENQRINRESDCRVGIDIGAFPNGDDALPPLPRRPAAGRAQQQPAAFVRMRGHGQPVERFEHLSCHVDIHGRRLAPMERGENILEGLIPPPGGRLDKTLAEASGLSRERVKALLAEGHVTIDGKPAGQGSVKVAAGTPFAIAVPEAAPAEARPPRPLAPSAQVEDDVPYPPPTPAMRAAAEKGRLLHALFERLPGLGANQRASAADRWLAQRGLIDAYERQQLIDQALRVIDAPDFADLFGPGALAEAPIAAVVGEAVIAGTVDRLCVAADRVQFVDFKTGRVAPSTLADVPTSHLRQMAAYAAALGVIFPGRQIEAGLLYTSVPRLITLPPALLAAHKPGFVGAQGILPLPPVEPAAPSS